MTARAWSVAALLAAAAVVVAYFAVARTTGGSTTQDTTASAAAIVTATPMAQPFTVRGGPAEGNLRIPNVDNVASLTASPGEARGLEPRVATLAAADAARFAPGGASLWKTSGGQFSAEVRYRSPERDEALLIVSWTPTGSVDLVLPLSSPVLNIEQRTIAGMAAVLILQANGVQGRPGHSAYLASRDTFYYVQTEGTGGPGSNDDFVALVTRIAERLPK